MTTRSHKAVLSLCAAALLSLSGCMYERHEQIPADASVPAEGDKQLQFSANQPGMVYVYDRNNDRLIYSGQINSGEMMTVDPDKNRITVNGRTVLEEGINNGDTRRIFFKPMPPTEQRTIIEEHRDMR